MFPVAPLFTAGRGLYVLWLYRTTVDASVDVVLDWFLSRLAHRVTPDANDASRTVSCAAMATKWTDINTEYVKVFAGVVAVLFMRRAVISYEENDEVLDPWVLFNTAAHELIAFIVIAYASMSRAHLTSLHQFVAVAFPAAHAAAGVWPPTADALFECGMTGIIANTFLATMTTPSFSTFVVILLGPTLVNLLCFCPAHLREGLAPAQVSALGVALCLAPVVNQVAHACRRWWRVREEEDRVKRDGKMDQEDKEGEKFAFGWGNNTALTAVVTSLALLLLPNDALRSVTKLMADPETHLTNFRTRACAMGAVAAVAAWRLFVDDRRNARARVHSVVRHRRARAMRNLQTYVDIVAVPLFSFYLWYAWKNLAPDAYDEHDDRVGAGVFFIRFGIIIVFSHHASHRVAVNASWPLLVLVGFQYILRGVALPRPSVFSTCIGLHAGAMMVQESRLSYGLYSLVVFVASATQLGFDVVGTLAVATVAAVAGFIFLENLKKLERACAEHDARAAREAAADIEKMSSAANEAIAAAQQREAVEHKAVVEERPQNNKNQNKRGRSRKPRNRAARKRMASDVALQAHIAVQFPMRFIPEEDSSASSGEEG